MFKETYNAKADTGDPAEPDQGCAPVVISPSQSITIDFLTEADIPAFLALQSVVRESLKEHEKHYLKERTAEDLYAHLRAGMPLIGAKSADGTLVGQALISFADNKAAKNLQGYPVHGLEDITAIVQSVAIHPDFRGKEFGLAGRIQAKIVETAQDYQRSILLAKVADANQTSQKSFLKNDFTVAATGHDPDKGYAVTYFSKNLSPLPVFMHGAASPALALNG